VASEFHVAVVSPLGAAYWSVGIGFAPFTTLTGSGTFVLTSLCMNLPKASYLT
jgi:hypothetical protein